MHFVKLRALFSRKLGRLAGNRPAIHLMETPCFFKSVVGPAPTFSAQLLGQEGLVVGVAQYALSPINDRWYVYDIRVDPPYRRKGYGLAFLDSLVSLRPVAITPVQVLRDAVPFWDAARRARWMGLVVTESLSASRLDMEKQRWKHLEGDAQELDAHVAQRLRGGETWQLATERGLDWQHPWARHLGRIPW